MTPAIEWSYAVNLRCPVRKGRLFRYAALVLLLFVCLGTNPSPPETWGLTYETNPTNADNVSQGAAWLRQLKLDIRERLEVEHHFSSVGTADDNGVCYLRIPLNAI